MTCDQHLLTNVVKSSGPRITFGDNSKGKTVGKGKIIHGSITINDVLLVENLHYNLISISQMCDIGYLVEFQKEICYVSDQKGNTLLTGHRSRNAYKLDWKNQSSKSICMLATNDQNWLWHKRFNHLNFKTLNNLCSKDLVDGLPKIKFHKDKSVLYVRWANRLNLLSKVEEMSNQTDV